MTGFSTMPRYHFDICDNIETPDEEGREMADDQFARRYAIEVARELVCSDVHEGHLNLDHYIAVRRGDGAAGFRVAFRDAFIITGD